VGDEVGHGERRASWSGKALFRPRRAPPHVHRCRHHEDQPRQDEQFDPLDVPPEGLLRLGRHDEHLADAGNQADDEERLRIEGLVPDGEADVVEQLGHDEQHKSVVQGGENDRLLAVRPLDRPDDVVDDPDSGSPASSTRSAATTRWMPSSMSCRRPCTRPPSILGRMGRTVSMLGFPGPQARRPDALPNGWTSGCLPVAPAWGSGEARHHRGLPGGGRECRSQPDADTNGRNLRLALVADLSLPSEMARDLASRVGVRGGELGRIEGVNTFVNGIFLLVASGV
jgi:hypothetical protein